MPANTAPIFPITPKSSWAAITAANTAKDGSGTVVTVATAVVGGNGARLDSIRVRPLGTNAAATVLRLFLNNGSANSTPTNNSLILEVSLPVTTLSETSAQADIVIVFNDSLYAAGVTNAFPQIVLPAGYKINVTLGTAVAAGWQISAFYGEY